MTPKELARLVVLTDIEGVGDKRAREIYEAFDSSADIFDARIEDFDQFHYIDKSAIEQLQRLEEDVRVYEEQFEQCQDEGIEVIGIQDDRYPNSLRKHHSPLIVYARGDPYLLTQPSVSFAGSRETDVNGQKWTRATAKELAEEYTIVSGGARGIDTAAHEGALAAGGKTIVVLGTGINNWYPEENEDLFRRILEAGGLLISHRSPDARSSRYGFLNRNQTNSALSEAMIIVATDGSGGTMSQYRDAVSQDTPVLVPPPTHGHSPVEGLTEIVKNGEATVVKSAIEIQNVIEARQLGSTETNDQASLDDWA